jgi:hypothetical protein
MASLRRESSNQLFETLEEWNDYLERITRPHNRNDAIVFEFGPLGWAVIDARNPDAPIPDSEVGDINISAQRFSAPNGAEPKI